MIAAPASRNDPCPCGSGRRYKHCHGAVEGSADNIQRFHNRALADPARARDYVSREWAGAPIAERYEWLFRYDVTRVEI